MKRIFRLLCFASLAICTGTLITLYQYYRVCQKGNEEYRGLAGEAVRIRNEKSESNVRQAGQTEVLPALSIDFETLENMNEAVCAWIDFPGQEKSYPVVQGSDNAYYLKRTFQKEQSAVGCIFMDYRNQRGLSDDNTILYGHNMKNGSMFGFLKQYMEEEHYRQFPYFDLYMKEAVYRCRILACCRVRAGAENYPIHFESASEKTEFIQKMKTQTGYKTGLEIKETAGGEDGSNSEADGPLVMLSTCTGRQYQYRFAVLAIAELIEY